MSLLTLAATDLAPGGLDPLNLTAALQAVGSDTGVQFVNTGRDILVVSVGASGPVVATTKIGTTVQGQNVTPETATLAASSIWVLGPDPSQFDRQDGSYEVEVDFDVPANVSGVALLHIPGVV